MRYLIQIRFTLILQTVTAFVFTNKNGVLIEYSIDLKQKCQAVDQQFAFIYGLSIAQCVEECGLRPHCASLNFWRRADACELFSSAVDGTVENGNCVHVLAEDIDVKEKPCSECVNGEVCDTKSRVCRLKDCSQATVPENGKILGNVNKIGSWIQYKCNTGYITQNGKQRAMC
ncbi:uncharacterized protein LOC123542842 [Mercenaria mercenaria]|uniref:uncharacterized protein LOC123542842 n=1 Tax=Mercenaria mercenaria TaxID=6596 RepID=UPI00234FAD82|nr:uncharacterized protein LOC123542842 [Mercenaria mercenaria]